MRRPNLLSVLTCGSIAVVLALASCGAAPRRDTEAELRAYAACFAREVGATPRWNITVEVVRDSGDGRNNYGSALTSGNQLEARIVFNLHAIERDDYPVRIAALHEVLHIATGELASIGFAFDKQATAIEAERLVRQMVRWPNWRGVCP